MRLIPATARSSSSATSIVASPAGIVLLCASRRNTDASVKSLAIVPSAKIPAATTTGLLVGKRILKKAVARLAPSTSADSSTERGRFWKYAERIQTQNGTARVG